MKPPLEQNYYELLEVPRDATMAELDRAYDRARAYYGEGSVAVYALASPDELKHVQERIDEAYLVLGDDKARAEYDARIGPPSADERPLHREVRAARERELTKREPVQRPPIPAPVAPVEPPAPEPPEPAPEPRRPAQPEGPPPPPTMHSPEPAPRMPAPLPVEVALPPPPAPSRDLAMELELPADAVFNGELLRRLREQKGLSLQDLADRTKIGKSHLDNIEAGRFANLPAQVYLRGFLMAYARELKLDPLRVAKSYLEHLPLLKAKPRG